MTEFSVGELSLKAAGQHLYMFIFIYFLQPIMLNLINSSICFLNWPFILWLISVIHEI